MARLDMLWEEPGTPHATLPAALREAYAGDLALPRECFYANFVSSIDGVVALEAARPSAGPTISGHAEEDRLVMGILRAYADAVVVGAGTVRAESGHLWTPDHIHLPMARAFEELRRGLGRAPRPLLVVVTASGRVEAGEAAMDGALVATTDAGAALLRGRLPGSAELVSLGPAPLSIARLLEMLRGRGLRAVLTEGGPHLMASVFAEGLLEHLFLTLSPVIAGRAAARRAGLVEGLALLPERRVEARLVSLRRAGSQLFAQYGFGIPDRQPPRASDGGVET